MWIGLHRTREGWCKLLIVEEEIDRSVEWMTDRLSTGVDYWLEWMKNGPRTGVDYWLQWMKDRLNTGVDYWLEWMKDGPRTGVDLGIGLDWSSCRGLHPARELPPADYVLQEMWSCLWFRHLDACPSNPVISSLWEQSSLRRPFVSLSSFPQTGIQGPRRILCKCYPSHPGGREWGAGFGFQTVVIAAGDLAQLSSQEVIGPTVPIQVFSWILRSIFAGKNGDCKSQKW